MLLRFLVFLLLAMGLGGFGTVVWVSTHPTPQAVVAAAAPVVPVRQNILVAAWPLHAGSLIKADDLQSQAVDTVAAGTQSDTADARSNLIGAMIRRNLAAHEPLLAGDLIRPGDHGFLAAVLGPDMSAVSIGVDSVGGNAGLIWPGDHVDLILTQTLDAPEHPARRAISETFLTDIRVIGIDQLLEHGVAPAAPVAGIDRTVTLEVTREQAERVNVATRLGHVTLAVRSADPAKNANRPTPPPAMWADSVTAAFEKPTSTTTNNALVRLYQGGADGKEFRF